VYAAGDVIGGHQQISASVGEGAGAAINLLEEFRGVNYVDYKTTDDAAADRRAPTVFPDGMPSLIIV
jgi:thioredoxin reductase (NADPH)